MGRQNDLFGGSLSWISLKLNTEPWSGSCCLKQNAFFRCVQTHGGRIRKWKELESNQRQKLMENATVTQVKYLFLLLWIENVMFTLRGNYFLQIHCAHICIVKQGGYWLFFAHFWGCYLFHLEEKKFCDHAERWKYL